MSNKEPQSENLCRTGIEGLDAILGGGLPKNRLYLIQGDPGVGKTTLAIQFLLEGERYGDKALYITLSETRDEIEAVAQSHGWDISNIVLFELSSMEERLSSQMETSFFHPSEVELNERTEILLRLIEKEKPGRIVFDSLSEMRLLAETPLRYRRQILAMKQFFSGKKITVLFLDDRTAGVQDLQVESIAHGVISLKRFSPDYGVTRRQLNVMKIRGRPFQEGNHDLILKRGGMVVFPRLVAANHHTSFVMESFPSGIPGLDALLGGGLDRGTSAMLMGPPGTGKSTLCIKYAVEAAERGENSSLFIFDETLGTLFNRSSSLGIKVRKYYDSGQINIRQIDPAEITPGEFTCMIRGAVEEHKSRFIIIDSINGYLNAMPDERFLNLQLHELLSYLNQQGVISIITLAQQGLVGTMQSVIDLTYLADTVMLLRFYESEGAVHQAISVMKKRSGSHERTIRSFQIHEGTIIVGEPLKDFHGVLTGIPLMKSGAIHPSPQSV
ncbi:MAG: ATPase domain-containing protein [Verrucomicrobiales bacterium]